MTRAGRVVGEREAETHVLREEKGCTGAERTQGWMRVCTPHWERGQSFPEEVTCELPWDEGAGVGQEGFAQAGGSGYTDTELGKGQGERKAEAA